VVDARDPLLYRSKDLEAYARELCASKASFLLLNKADLLPRHIRKEWADHFDAAGLGYAFWSAQRMSDAQQKARAEALAMGLDVEVRVLRWAHVPCAVLVLRRAAVAECCPAAAMCAG
jgi:large subunit GTPase 1